MPPIDSSQIIWIKSIDRRGTSLWGYLGEDPTERHPQPREPGDEFDLHWPTRLRNNAQVPKQGQIICLTQDLHVTHLVQVMDDVPHARPDEHCRPGSRDKSYGIARRVRALVIRKKGQAPRFEQGSPVRTPPTGWAVLPNRKAETLQRVRPRRNRGPMSAFLRDLRRWERDPDLFQRDAGPGRRISERFEELILTLITDHLRRATVYVTLDIGAYRGGRDAGWAQQIARKYQLVPQGLVFQLFDDRAFHTTARASLVVRGIADRSLRFEDDDVVKVKVLPVYSGMLYNRGLYFARAGRHDEAIEAFKEALAIEPRFSAAERRMAESLAIVGQRR